MENKAATIKDVARKAGVSVSTVSRAFNNYSDISEPTKEMIFEIAEKLGYKPNIVARSLSSSKNFRLGILVEDYDISGNFNHLVLELLMPFQNIASKQGYESIILSTTTDMQKSQHIEKLFDEKQIDGAFIMGLKMTDEYYSQLSTINYPCAIYDIYINNPTVCCIGVDNVKGAFTAVEHLIKLGHKKIGFINGHEEAFVSYERLDGYYLAMNRYNMQVDKSLIIHGDFSDKSGKEAAKKLMLEHQDLTAIFCASDLMAVGAINELDNLGYSIPDDISVVGFDDIYIAQCMNPKLTTIRQDRKKIGELAANTLINMITGQNIGRIIIEPEIIIRESTRKV